MSKKKNKIIEYTEDVPSETAGGPEELFDVDEPLVSVEISDPEGDARRAAEAAEAEKAAEAERIEAEKKAKAEAAEKAKAEKLEAEEKAKRKKEIADGIERKKKEKEAAEAKKAKEKAAAKKKKEKEKKAKKAQKEKEEKAAEAARKKAEKLAAKREKKKAETSEPEEKAEEVLVSAAEPEETALTVAPEEPEPVEVIPEVPEPVEVIPEEAEPEEKTHRPEEPLLEGESEFDRSIRVFREEDTGTVREPKKKGAGIVRAFFLVFFGAVFIISTWSFFENAYEKYKSDKIYGKLQEQFEDIAFEDETGESTLLTLLEADRKSPATPTLDEILENGVPEKDDPGRDVDLERMRASLTSLANINPDIYGWIKIPGTTVNYPIAQSDDNEYYLDHAYTGDNLTNGSIYADYRCDAYVPNNRNTVLYGHNITTGTMFHAVEDFFDRDLFDNAKIYLYTYDGVFIYKAFSVHETAYDSGYIRPYFTDDNDFVAFINALAADSDVKAKDLTLDADSKILTMSTCTSSVRSTRRYALHAVLVDSVTDK